MPLKIIRNDITKVTADAIVNSANPYPICGGSTEGCIYEAAGYEKLLEARQSIGYLDVCDVAISPAFNLNAMFIIHVSAPRWNGGRSGEKNALKTCYQNVLKLAQDAGCKSVAFSLLSSGAYRFPKDVAMAIAKESIEEYLHTNAPDDSKESMDVLLVLYDDEAILASERLFSYIEKYIDRHFINEREFEPCYSLPAYLRFNEEIPIEDNPKPKDKILDARNNKCLYASSAREEPQLVSSIRKKRDFNKIIQELLDDPNNLKPFRDMMNDLMRKYDISSITIERDGNIDRKHFSKINSNKMRPSKGAVIAIAIGLKLDYAEAVKFLAYAGYALSPSNKSDLIVQFFMENKSLFYSSNPDRNQYKVAYLNDCLMEHGEDPLGAGR